MGVGQVQHPLLQALLSPLPAPSVLAVEYGGHLVEAVLHLGTLLNKSGRLGQKELSLLAPHSCKEQQHEKPAMLPVRLQVIAKERWVYQRALSGKLPTDLSRSTRPRLQVASNSLAPRPRPPTIHLQSLRDAPSLRTYRPVHYRMVSPMSNQHGTASPME